MSYGKICSCCGQIRAKYKMLRIKKYYGTGWDWMAGSASYWCCKDNGACVAHVLQEAAEFPVKITHN